MTWTPSKRTLLAGMAALPVAGLLPVAARAEIEVNVNRGDVQPLPIAIPAFAGPQGPDIAGVISADLQRSGLFRPLDPASFIEHDLNIAYEPNYASWRQINAQALIVGQATPANGSLQVGFHLFDVPAGKELGFGGQSQGGLQLSASAENWRRIAHKIADAVYERLTGEKGYFDTRVVFVAGGRGGTRRLAIMDQDGANPSYLPTEGSAIVMTPRYSSNSQEITYMTLRAEGSSVYLLNLDTTRSESLGDFKGMVFAPRFSPDGGKVAFSVERGGNSDIFVMDLRNRQTARLTADPAIDTSPSFSPDGTQIVFNSDRSGSPQLYIMGADGSNPRRISFGQGGRYTTPVWSPTGEFIAFTRQNGGEFRIGVMKPDGSEERLLTAGFHDEGPTWAPNGRVLMFERDSGATSKLWTVDVTGRVLQPVPYPGAASDPAWSPLLN